MNKVKAIFVLVLFVSFSALVFGCGQQSSSGGGSSYFPVGEGYTWRYSYSDGTKSVITDEGTAVITGDVTVRLFSTSYLNASDEVTGTGEAYYKVTSSGVYTHGSPSYPVNPGVPLLEFPLSVGKSWITSSFGDYSTVATVTASESLTVSAETFSCYKVSYVSTWGTIEAGTINFWFGDGAGMVKGSAGSSTFEL